MIAYAKSLDQDKACLTLILFLKDFFKKVSFAEKNLQKQLFFGGEKLPSNNCARLIIISTLDGAGFTA